MTDSAWPRDPRAPSDINAAADCTSEPDVRPPWPASSGNPSKPVWRYKDRKNLQESKALRLFAHDLVEHIKELELPVREAMKQACGDGLHELAYAKMMRDRVNGLERDNARLRQDLARYENGRVVMTGEIEQLKGELANEISHRDALWAERDQLRDNLAHVVGSASNVEPDGWIRYMRHAAGGPDPEEVIMYEFVSRDEPHEGEGWVPLYSRPQPTPAIEVSGEPAEIALVDLCDDPCAASRRATTESTMKSRSEPVASNLLSTLRTLLVRERRWFDEADEPDEDRGEAIEALEWAVARLSHEPATDWQQIARERTADLAKADAQIERLQNLLALEELQKLRSTQPPPVGPLTLDTERQVFFYEQDHYYLSNFSAFAVKWAGWTFATSEHAYHWEKFPGRKNTDIRFAIRNSVSAHGAFKTAEAHKADRRPDWDDVKAEFMLRILREKVRQHEYVRRKLLQTGDRELIENSWRDDVWGWGPNRDGQNLLGKLWMQVRDELRASAPTKSRDEAQS